MENEIVKLPKMEELIKLSVDMVEQNKLNVLLNQKPPEEWLKTHPIIKREVLNDQGQKVKVPYVYLPIERQEWLMTRIFIQWRVEVKEYSLIGNSVCCSIRLHYHNPITGTWEWQDGVGAQPLQTEYKAGAIEFDKLKTAAVQMALPAAKTFAKKDAMDELGRLFGKDLNRSEDIGYNSMNEDKFEAAERIAAKRKLSNAIAECKDKELGAEVLDALLDAEAAGTDNISFLNEQLNKLQNGTK